MITLSAYHNSPSLENEMDASHFENEIETFERLISSTPDFAAGHNNLGLIYYQAHSLDKAVQHLEKAVELEPLNAKFLKDAADFYYSALSQSEKALTHYEKVLKLDPFNAEALMICANIQLAMNQKDQAMERYQQLITLEPWRVDVQEIIDKLKQPHKDIELEKIQQLYQQAQSKVQLGDIEAAIDILSKIVHHAPSYAAAFNDIGVLKCQSGDLTGARVHYEKAVNLEPENPIYLKNLAELFWVGMDEIEKALHLFVRILKINPQDIEALIAAGNISERFHQSENAIIFYETILDIEPWNLEASDRLASLR